MLAVSLGKEFGAKIFRHDSQGKWTGFEILSGGSGDIVTDISWAPGMGR